MQESVAAAFSELEHFDAALRAEGYRSPGSFAHVLTQITLNEMRLTAAKERASRVYAAEWPPARDSYRLRG